MMAKKDYYDVLGIGRSADEKEIKKNVISYMQEFGNKYSYAGKYRL